MYVGSFRVLSPDRWRMTWVVTGPRKDSHLSTEFTRQAQHQQLDKG
jgi:hypothetical protein